MANIGQCEACKNNTLLIDGVICERCDANA